MSDELQLILASQNGDRVAITQLFMLHHDRLSAVIANKIPVDLRAAFDADDVCQETYAAAARELKSFTPRGPEAFWSWLATIADRKLIDLVRALRAEKRGGDRAALHLPPGSPLETTVFALEQAAVHSRTPSRDACAREAAAAVQSAIGKLSDDQRLAITSRYFEGLSLRDTAQRLGRSEGAVLMLCHRGLERLSQTLGDTTRFFSARA
jgi:RNA polymerase sigma-70 factor (ECF subfamily)